MASKALQSEDLGEDEMQPAPKLLEVILQNCRGQVDHCLPTYIQARHPVLGDICTGWLSYVCGLEERTEKSALPA